MFYFFFFFFSSRRRHTRLVSDWSSDVCSSDLCGWGGMVMHAAAEHGVKALGVTLSRNQAEWAQAEIERRGLGGLAEVRHCDYRDAPESQFDAISSIGLTEHIGRGNLRSYFASLHTRLRPEGRLLNHCITEPRTPTKRLDPFIARYVFPDG